MRSPVHFVLTHGGLTWQYRRAIRTARVHDAPIILWHTGERPIAERCEVRHLPVPGWLQHERPAHIYDVLALQVLHEYGGMTLGLDTISVRPAWDLLPDGKELCVGIDVPHVGYTNPDVGKVVTDPFNNHLIARPGSELVGELLAEAERRVRAGDPRWGATGPLLLTDLVLGNPARVEVAPFPSLCGWEGSYVWRFYRGLEEPGPDVRVIHLFSSAYPDDYATFHWPHNRPGMGVRDPCDDVLFVEKIPD